MRREHLVKMLGRQISLRSASRDRLLRTHHDSVCEAAHKHDHRERQIHDADALMIDGGDPFAPKVQPSPLCGDPCQSRQDHNGHASYRAHDDRLMNGNCAPAELAE